MSLVLYAVPVSAVPGLAAVVFQRRNVRVGDVRLMHTCTDFALSESSRQKSSMAVIEYTHTGAEIGLYRVRDYAIAISISINTRPTPSARQ
jgi:hypothetical protein